MIILFWTSSTYTNNQLKSRRLIFVFFTIRDYTSVYNTTCKLNLDIEVWWTLCRSGLTSLDMFDATSWDCYRGEVLGWRSLGDISRHGHGEDMVALLVSYTEYEKFTPCFMGVKISYRKLSSESFGITIPGPDSNSERMLVCVRFNSRYLHIFAVL